MPDIVLVRVKADAPAQYHRFEPALVDKFIYKRRPFYGLYLRLYPYLCEPPLANRRGILPEAVAHIRTDSEFKRPSFLIEYAVAISVLPPSLFKELPCPGRIISVLSDIRIIRPGVGNIGAGCRAAQPEEDY